MHRPLLIVGGVLNSILALFHVWLGRQIHLMPGVTPGQRALIEMLNAGGVLMIVFFAVASLACATDVFTTRLGKLFLGFVSVLYLSRAAEEIFIYPRFSVVIFSVCMLIAVIYVLLIVVPFTPRTRSTAVQNAPA
jgi:hypothetical protein